MDEWSVPLESQIEALRKKRSINIFSESQRVDQIKSKVDFGMGKSSSKEN